MTIHEAPKQKRPVIGYAFDPRRRDEPGVVQAYIKELEYYRPRGFSKLANEGKKLAEAIAEGGPGNPHEAWEWISECELLLTQWAQKVERHNYIYFGSLPGDVRVGFRIDTDGAIEDADLLIDDSQRGPVLELPKGFSGLLVHISDHSNVSACLCWHGRKTRELFEVV